MLNQGTQSNFEYYFEHQSTGSAPNGSYQITETITGTYERTVNLDANGGSFAGGAKTRKTLVDPTNILGTDNPPAWEGKRVVAWNTKPDGSGDDVNTLGLNLKEGATIYAQWGNDPGKPVKAMLDCGRRNPVGDGVSCRVAVSYANTASEYRDVTAAGTNGLAWAGNPINGVRLDGNGYAINSDCVDASTDGKRDAQCYSVSLADNPPTSTTQVYNVPGTGLPDGLTNIGVAAVLLGMIGFGVIMRSRRD